jgi:hypothetical protein
MHTALVSRLIKDRSAWELAHVPVGDETPEEKAPAVMNDAEFGAPALIGA